MLPTMLCARLCCLTYLICLGFLYAGEVKPPLATKEEMTSPAERIQVWAEQAKARKVMPEDRLSIIGHMSWRGRADRNYKPFQQWELRFYAPIALKDCAIRIRALDGDLKPMVGGDSGWRALGDMAAKATLDVAMKLNVSLPALVEMDLRWAGGTVTLQCGETDSLPLPKSTVPGPRLFAFVTNLEARNKKGNASISFTLRNIGSASASGITVRTIFLDSNDKEVGSATHSIRAVLAPGEVNEYTVEVKSGSYRNVRLLTRCAQDAAMASGVLNDAVDIQVGNMRLDGSTFHATVRNGLRQPVHDLVLTITLLDASGGVVRTITLPSMRMAAQERREVTVATGAFAPWASFTLASDYAEGD